MKWFIALALVAGATYWLFTPEGARMRSRVLGTADSHTQLIGE